LRSAPRLRVDFSRASRIHPRVNMTEPIAARFAAIVLKRGIAPTAISRPEAEPCHALAVINAVIDALHERTGLRHIDMPATPRRVWEALTAPR
jgi:hypothetical protein